MLDAGAGPGAGAGAGCDGLADPAQPQRGRAADSGLAAIGSTSHTREQRIPQPEIEPRPKAQPKAQPKAASVERL
jgi:hypothetical protein